MIASKCRRVLSAQAAHLRACLLRSSVTRGRPRSFRCSSACPNLDHLAAQSLAAIWKQSSSPAATERGRDMTSGDVLITGGYVVSLDPELGDVPGGDVLIRDGRIAAVGRVHAEDAGDAGVIRAGGRLVI